MAYESVGAAQIATSRPTGPRPVATTTRRAAPGSGAAAREKILTQRAAAEQETAYSEAASGGFLSNLPILPIAIVGGGAVLVWYLMKRKKA